MKKKVAIGFVPGMLTGAGVLAAGMFMGGLMQKTAPQVANSNQSSDVVTTRRIEIVDQLGTVVAVLGANNDGGSLSLKDRFGRTMLLNACSPDGGMIALSDARNGERAVLLQSTDDGGRLAMFAGPDRVAAALQAKRQGGGSLAISNESGVQSVRLFSELGAGVVETYSSQGGSLVTLSSTVGQHGQVTTYGPDQVQLVTLTASTEHDGQIYVNQANGKPSIVLASNEAGPTIRVFNRSGQAAASIESNKEGQGVIGVWKNDGEGRTFTP